MPKVRRKNSEKNSPIFLQHSKNAYFCSVFRESGTMPNGVIGNTTDSGSVKSRFEPWLGNKIESDPYEPLSFVFALSGLILSHKELARREFLDNTVG